MPAYREAEAWMKRFKLPQTAFVSGWMAVRGYERGFVLSEHADWPGLLASVRQSGARQIELLPRQAARVLGVAEEMCLRLQAGLTSFSREEKVRVINLLRSQTPDLVWVHALVAGARQASAFLRTSPKGAARAAPLWALQGAVCPVPRSAPAEGPALWAQSG